MNVGNQGGWRATGEEKQVRDKEEEETEGKENETWVSKWRKEKKFRKKSIAGREKILRYNNDIKAVEIIV